MCYGRTDLEVAASFETEAMATYTALSAQSSFSTIVTSPLIRCRKLADFIAKRKGLPITEDPQLIEMDFGSWEARQWSDIPRTEIDSWANDFFHARPHGGESVAMLHKRAVKALTHWQRKDISTTLIVTHAGVIRAALSDGINAESFNTKIEFGQFVTLASAPNHTRKVIMKGDYDE